MQQFTRQCERLAQRTLPLPMLQGQPYRQRANYVDLQQLASLAIIKHPTGRRKHSNLAKSHLHIDGTSSQNTHTFEKKWRKRHFW